MDGQTTSEWGPLKNTQSSQEALQALQAVYDEIEALYHQSNRLIERLYGHGELSLGCRTLLIALFRNGAQTVPQLAHARSVSRQYIQRLANQLTEEKYVEFIDNAAHKRSRLLRLTAKGEAYLRGILQQEVKIVRAMVIDLPVEQLQTAAQTLRAVRDWQSKELERLLSAQEGELE
jgi:DNA-binding MarR family transcriptional regulator